MRVAPALIALALVGAACNPSDGVPGPNSTELAIHIGKRRAGWPGLIVAGTAFILPAVLIVLALAGLCGLVWSLAQTPAGKRQTAEAPGPAAQSAK